jgi:hypothetical protein
MLAAVLLGNVIAAVYHAEIVALRVGEPYGTLVLALAVTIIEVGLIISIMAVRLPAENLMRVPFELGCRPSPASNTPAFVSSSLYFIIAAISSVLGGTPASVFLSALSRIMNRIARSLPDARQ